MIDIFGIQILNVKIGPYIIPVRIKKYPLSETGVLQER